MSPKLIRHLAELIVSFLIGGSIFGLLCFTAFDEMRKADLLKAAFKRAEEQGTEEYYDRFFLGPIDPALARAYQPLDKGNQAAMEAYKAAKTGTKAELEAFFRQQFLFWHTWLPWVCFAGIIGACFGLYYLLKHLFDKFTTRMVFIQALMGLLGGYFMVLAWNDVYPLGIDLAGGTELIYRLDFETAELRLTEAERRRQQLQEMHTKEEKTGKGELVRKEDIARMDAMIEGLKRGRETAGDKAVEVIRRRVDPTGAKGIPITKYGEDRIRIQLPKASPEEVERIKKAVMTGGRLTFHICLRSDREQKEMEKVRKAAPDAKGNRRAECQYTVGIPGQERPMTGVFEQRFIKRYDRFDRKKELQPEETFVNVLPELEGSRVVFAGVGRGQEGGFEVRLQFDAAGSARFEELTGENIGRQMAIVLDDEVKSAPVIRDRIPGECRISGNFTEKESKELADILTTGSLPADVRPDSANNVGPALGREQIHAGVVATVIGSIAVAAFMWIYYRIAGFISVLCLGVLLAVMMGALAFFKATMTLPGIAGILLTMGMAVDANVLIYERIREELGRGRNMRQAVIHGFDRAYLVIIDAQLTTLISGVIMYYLGTGPIRGFAVTLSIGILVTLFANLWVCRQFFDWLVNKEAVESLHMMQFFPPTQIDFMGMRRKWYVISGSLVLLSILGFGLIGKRMLAEDFTGGSLIEFSLLRGKETSIEEMRQAVDETLRANLEKRLGRTQDELARLAAAYNGKRDAAQQDLVKQGKQGAELDAARAAAFLRLGQELKAELLKALPDLGHSLYGAQEEVEPKQLENLVAQLAKVREELGRIPFTVQASEEPGTRTTQGSRRFTLTTRLTNAVAAQELTQELLKTFADRIEARPVELAGDVIKLRFDPEERSVPDQTLVEETRGKLNALATDKANAPIKDALTTLQVSAVKTEAWGQRYVELSSLPKDSDNRDKVLGAVETAAFPNRAAGPILRQSQFGPQVAGEMARNAILALLGSLAGIWIYLWFRFEFSGAWGFGAIVALIHDSIVAVGGGVLVTALGLFVVEVDLNLVAAVLTIIGFSVNDTIVVYDRIREVRSAHPTRNLTEIVNEAINATLSRTVMTSLTVWITLVALLIFGGASIRGLAWTLWVGVVVGTYSSIFIASPLMIWWYKRFGATFAAQPGMAQGQAESAPSGAQI